MMLISPQTIEQLSSKDLRAEREALLADHARTSREDRKTSIIETVEWIEGELNERRFHATGN